MIRIAWDQCGGTAQDNHTRSRDIVPTARPLLIHTRQKMAVSQLVMWNRVLLHNHPSGDPTPSRADIAMTQQIAEVARPLGIELHDHIIVGRDGHTSFK